MVLGLERGILGVHTCESLSHATWLEYYDRTLHLVLQCFDLRVCVVYELVHLLAERVVLFRQALRKMFLVDNFLRGLVAVER